MDDYPLVQAAFTVRTVTAMLSIDLVRAGPGNRSRWSNGNGAERRAVRNGNFAVLTAVQRFSQKTVQRFFHLNLQYFLIIRSMLLDVLLLF